MSDHKNRVLSVRCRVLAGCLTVCLLIAGCGAGETATGTAQDTSAETTGTVEQPAQEEAPKEEAKVPAEKVDVHTLYQSVSDKLPQMYEADDDFLMNYYGIDAALLSEYVFASCEDAARVDSVILMRVKDEADAPVIVEGLNGLLAQMEAEMENYNPEAHDLVKAAAVRQHGDLIDLVISADRDEILSVIDSRIG